MSKVPDPWTLEGWVEENNMEELRDQIKCHVKVFRR